jgi:hypothetical protein
MEKGLQCCSIRIFALSCIWVAADGVPVDSEEDYCFIGSVCRRSCVTISCLCSFEGSFCLTGTQHHGISCEEGMLPLVRELNKASRCFNLLLRFSYIMCRLFRHALGCSEKTFAVRYYNAWILICVCNSGVMLGD